MLIKQSGSQAIINAMKTIPSTLRAFHSFFIDSVVFDTPKGSVESRLYFLEEPFDDLCRLKKLGAASLPEFALSLFSADMHITTVLSIASLSICIRSLRTVSENMSFIIMSGMTKEKTEPYKMKL